MIAKLEGTHSWNGGAVVLNDRDVWPRFKLSQINGLGSIGDTDDQRSNRQGRRGENVRPALRRGKTVSYEGTIHARSLMELRQAEEDLGAAFDPLTYGGLLEGEMVVTPHPEAVRRNLVTEPSFEAPLAWTNVGGLGTMQRAGGANFRQVGAAGLYLANPAAGGDKYADFQIPAGATLDSIKGKTVTLSAYVYKVGGWSVGAGGIDRTVLIADNAGSATSSTAMTSVPAGGAVFTRVSATYTVSPAATVLDCRLYNGGIGDVYWDAVMLHEGATPLAYFDGDTAGARWEGPPHASISRLPGTDRTFRARPLSCIVPEEQTSNEWKRPFAVTLRLSDPRVFWPGEIPLAQSAGTAGDSAVAISNPGRTDADPVLEVIGPTNATWQVENTTLGRILKFTGFALTAGQTAVIDFTDRTIKLAGADQSAKLDLAQSDWWDRDTPGLASGANTITLKPGAGATAATRVGVRYRPADPA